MEPSNNIKLPDTIVVDHSIGPKISHDNATVMCSDHLGLPVTLTLAVFLLILGARFWLISTFGFELPFWDQWDAEAFYLYEPYLQGTLEWQDLFRAHNEHRILFTRLIALALLQLNGQWSTILQMTVNAGIYAFIAALLFAFLGRAASPLFRIVLAIACTTLFALPFGWENTLQGFQSQFYLLTGCALAAIWLLCNSQPWNRSWFLGCLVASGALFTMASGFIACAAVLGVIGLEVLRFETSRSELGRRSWPTIVLCCGLIAGALFMIPFVAEHQALKANSLMSFMKAFGPCLAWPFQATVYWSVINWLPFILLLMGYIIRLIPNQPGIRFALALGLWVLLQCAATALGRAYTDPASISRYTDIYSIGLLVNILSLYFLFSTEKNKRVLHWLCIALFTLWLTGNSFGLARQTYINLLQELPQRNKYFAAMTYNTSILLANNGVINPVNLGSIVFPYPDPYRLASILQLQTIKEILPPSIAPQHKASALTSVAKTVVDRGFWLLITGLILFAVGIVVTIRTSSKRTTDTHVVNGDL